MKKLTLIFVLIFAIALPNVAQAKGFSGHSSYSHSSSISSSSIRSGGTIILVIEGLQAV